MTLSLAQGLRQGLSDLALPLTDQQQAQLLDYLALLLKWNKVYNLTSVRDPEQMLDQHLMDCLAAIPELLHEFPAACCCGGCACNGCRGCTSDRCGGCPGNSGCGNAGNR